MKFAESLNLKRDGKGTVFPRKSLSDLASVVQKVDNAIHRINHYPADKH